MAPAVPDPRLLDALRALAEVHGPLAVALAAVSLADANAVVRAVLDPPNASLFFYDESDEPVILEALDDADESDDEGEG